MQNDDDEIGNLFFFRLSRQQLSRQPLIAKYLKVLPVHVLNGGAQARIAFAVYIDATAATDLKLFGILISIRTRC